MATRARRRGRRGYRFDRSRVVVAPDLSLRLALTDGQLTLEWEHLRAKVVVRDEQWWAHLQHADPAAHPLFRLVPGPVAHWERNI